MPTGPSHYVIRRENGPGSRYDEPCRCMIGRDHDPMDTAFGKATLNGGIKKKGATALIRIAQHAAAPAPVRSAATTKYEPHVTFGLTQ